MHGFDLAAYDQVRDPDKVGKRNRIIISLLLDGMQEAGTHEVVFDADGLPSGTYLYRLETTRGSFVRTMLLAR